MKDKEKKLTSDPNTIIATVSQSRFQPTSAHSSVDIHANDLTLSIGQNELLSHATLRLEAGRHYVLHGRNGSGKSTILRALAERRIPGIARSIRVLWLAQGSIENSEGNETKSVIETVISSDERRQRLLREQKILTSALESQEDSLAPVHAMRDLELEDAVGELDEANDTAAFRSGARGYDARKELIKAEERQASAAANLQMLESDVDAETVQISTTKAVDRLRECDAVLAALDAEKAEARARTILLGLGFKKAWLDSEYKNLSGGWRTRCLLACALFQSCDILLLDECTNFLDLPAIVWLQSYVQELDDRTVVVVTHDRDFADAVSEELIVLRENALEYFHGNLSTYESERRKYAKWMTRMQESQDKAKSHMEATIAGNIRAAKQKGDDKKLKQAASRQKRLDDRMGMQVNAKGGRFKKNRDLAGYHLTSRANIDIPKMDPPAKMRIPFEPSDLKDSRSLLSMESVSFAYRNARLQTLVNVNLIIHLGERVGLVGLNGVGKSTLLKLILEDSVQDGFKPTSGTVEHSPHARIGCFSQNDVEELELKGNRQSELTALREIIDAADNTWTEQQARTALANIGLAGNTVSKVPLGALSGGQKVRVALLRLLVPHPPHLLVLDEVTSHLDADTVTALVESLKAYQGALLVVSHDRYFMRTVVEGERVDEHESDSEDDSMSEVAQPGRVYRVVQGKLHYLAGGMDEYENICQPLVEKSAQNS